LAGKGVPSHLRDLAEEILDELELAFPLGYRPTILWKSLRVAAGYAYYRHKAIGLSTRLITDEERLRHTLLHEYAHLLAVARHGTKGAGHSPGWKHAMRDLGLEPTVRHQYEVERNEMRQQVIYSCKRCQEEFVRRRKLPRNRRYYHVNCGGLISFVRVEELMRQAERDIA
jgi:SprT protein